MNNKSYPLYPLTSSQQELMLDEKTGSGVSDVNINNFWVYADSCYNADALEKAFNRVVQDNDALRLRFIRVRRQTKQYFVDYEPFEIERINVVGRAGFDAELEKLNTVNFEIYDRCLFVAKLVDCGDGTGGLILRIHHMYADGYSASMMLREMDDNYKAIVEGREPGKKKLYSFKTAIEEEIKYLKSPAYKADRKWWRNRYFSLRKFSFINGKLGKDSSASIEEIDLEEELYKKFADYCGFHHISFQAAVLGLFALCCKERTGKSCFSIYSLFHNRRTYQLKNTMGNCTGSLPVFVNIIESETIGDYLERQYAEYLDAMKHMRLSIDKQINYMTPQAILHAINFNYAWLYISQMDYRSVARTTELESDLSVNQCLSVDLYLKIFEFPGESMTFSLEYRTAKIDSQTARSYLLALKEMLIRAVNEDSNKTD